MDRKDTTSGTSNTDYTQEDEEKMDRAAQSGAEGAFGTDQHDPTREGMRQDAEDAFKGNQSPGETY